MATFVFRLVQQEISSLFPHPCRLLKDCIAPSPPSFSSLKHFLQIGRSLQCMALKNLARRAFWSLPSSFSRHSSGLDARIISNRISVNWLSSQSDKWWPKNQLDLDNGTSTVDHARRHFQTCATRLKKGDLSRAQMVASMPKLDEGTQGEKLFDVPYDE